jgi:hypothetical protein
MTSSDKPKQKPKPQASAKVRHGKPLDKLIYPRMSLERARELGLIIDPVLIVPPTPSSLSKAERLAALREALRRREKEHRR